MWCAAWHSTKARVRFALHHHDRDYDTIGGLAQTGEPGSAIGLQIALMVISVTYVISGVLFLWSARTYRRDVDDARARSGVPSENGSGAAVPA